MEILESVKISPVDMAERKKIQISSGDTVRVWIKIQEKGKTRLQVFEGIVLARKHGDTAGATFTVRRSIDGVGVEKIFPLYSPAIDKIEIVRRVTTRRSKLYHIRDKAAKEIKREMRKMKLVEIATQSEIARKEREALRQAQDETKKVEEAAKAADPKAESDPKSSAPKSSNNDRTSDDRAGDSARVKEEVKVKEEPKEDPKTESNDSVRTEEKTAEVKEKVIVEKIEKKEEEVKDKKDEASTDI